MLAYAFSRTHSWPSQMRLDTANDTAIGLTEPQVDRINTHTTKVPVWQRALKGMAQHFSARSD